MIKPIVNFIFATTLFVGTIAYAESAPDFVSRLEAISTLSGEFRQTITDADGEEAADPTAGTFSLKRPGKFYWKTEPPFEQLVVGNDKGLTLYDPDLEQVTIYGREEFLNSPAAVLSGDAELIKDKYLITMKSSKHKHSYVLQEKDVGNKSFESLTFVFIRDTLSSLQLKDQLGQETNITFKDIKVNKRIADSLFVFLPPKGADVIVNN